MSDPLSAWVRSADTPGPDCRSGRHGARWPNCTASWSQGQAARRQRQGGHKQMFQSSADTSCLTQVRKACTVERSCRFFG